MCNIYELQNVCFSYEKGQRVLENVNLVIPKGKITVLLGPNGCGKTTTFGLMAKMLKPESGNVFFKGKKVSVYGRKEFARCVAAVHQYNIVPEDITVRKLVSLGRNPFFSSMFSTEKEEDIQRIEEALTMTNLLSLAERNVKELSGGQLQRVWLALALAQAEEVLLLDEITTYLDVHYQLEFMHIIEQFNKKRGVTIVMVVHDVNLALTFGDQIIVMKEGTVLAQGESNRISEQTLEQAFEVEAKIRVLENRRYCLFNRKAGEH